MANHIADKSWLASAASRGLITSRRFEDSYETTLVSHEYGAATTTTTAAATATAGAVHVIVAIDIGTAFSGYAFSFERSPYNIFAMCQTDRCRPLESGASPGKVPTCLLLKPNGDFHSFGGEAMEYYNRELDGREQKEWLFFERFKMSLHTERALSRKTQVAAANGRALPLATVFSHALRFFRDAAISYYGQATESEIGVTDVQWVITVPAIWNNAAKQMMREAAYEAGLASQREPDRVKIALEPESASIYCKSLQDIIGSHDEERMSEAIQPGKRYVLADLGGGTADVAVHEILPNGTVKELHCATGGAWGGTYVDQNFVALLERIFGADTIADYRAEYPGEWIDLISVRFERCKRLVRRDQTAHVELPHSFRSFLTSNGLSVEDCIVAVGDANLNFRRGSLAIKYPLVETLFKPVLDNIAQHLKGVLREVGRVDYLILVGGFAASELLQAEFRRQFERPYNMRVMVPSQCALAVVMGAVLFGHNPSAITSRRVRYSYGIECVDESAQVPESSPRRPPTAHDPYDSSLSVSPMRSSIFARREPRDEFRRFAVFVEKNQEVGVDEEVEHPFLPFYHHQTEANVDVYESDHKGTRYVTERGVRKVAEMRLPMPNSHLGLDRVIEISMKFGLTEITVSSIDRSSGRKAEQSVKLDFLRN